MGGMVLCKAGVAVMGVFVLLGDVVEGTVTSLREALPQPCECRYIIPQSTVAVGKCGDCARCAWDLHTYGFTFKEKDPGYFNDAFFQPLEKIFGECVDDIPYPPTFYDNADCIKSLRECKTMTDQMFKYQCEKIFSPKLPAPPKLTPGVSTFQKSLDIHKSSLNGLPENFKFNGKNLYTLTCPLFYRKYSFTYSMLYEQAFKYYGVQKTRDNKWTESTTVIHITQKLHARVIVDSDKNIREAYQKYNIPLNLQKFCGYDDVFVCVSVKRDDVEKLLELEPKDDD